MVSVVRRGLFWRIYLTVLVSLVATAYLGSTFWRLMVDQPHPKAVNTTGVAVGALLPEAQAPRAELEAALSRVSVATGGRVVLVDRDGRTAVAAEIGRIVRATPLGPWRTVLPDGRVLWIRVPPQPRTRPDPAPHILLILLMASGVIGLAAYPVVSRLTRRLERLRSSLDAWGDGRLDSRAEIEGRDEIAAVAMSFNAAAARVEQLLAAHRTLLAHASHELRSPLTRLRMAVETLVARPDPALAPGIIRDIAELDALVDEILLASRLDQNGDTPPAEIVDLLALAAEEAARGQARLAEVAPGAVFEVKGSPRLLRRLVRNLVENAAKHSAPPVQVELARVDGQIALRVCDHGPGIPEAERERVFEPFYRPTGWAEVAGSWGLGLSIVRQIAERHDGTVTCEAGPAGGASFVVKLPAVAGAGSRPDPRGF
jgi:signal transduction histidine kinase